MKPKKKWIGEAKKVKARSYNSMAGNNSSRKIVLHNEGVDRKTPGRPEDLMKYVVDRGIEYHLVWEPRTGKWAQSTPLDKAGKALLNAGLDGGIGCNRSGRVCIQLCVQGYGSRPFTDGPMKGAYLLADIADSWGVPLEKALGNFRDPKRSKKKWAGTGVSGHSMAPGNDHSDPSLIDFNKLVKTARAQQKARRRG